MSRLGLRGRVVLASVGALAIALAWLTVGANLLLASRLSADADAVLEARAGAQLAAIEISRGAVRVREAPNDDALDRQSWVFGGGRTVERAIGPPDVQRAAVAMAASGRPVQRDIGDRVRLHAEPAFDRGGRRRVGAVVVGLSLVPYERTERLALLAILAIDAFVLAAAALITRRAVDAALRPVAEMTGRAEEWSEHDLDRRFGVGKPRDELSGLAATLDALLGRIAASRRHEQRFSAEMAHELRTPLSGIRGEVELALRQPPPPAELPSVLGRIHGNVVRMATVIDTLMAAARGELDPAQRSADPQAVVEAAVDAAGSGPSTSPVPRVSLGGGAAPRPVAADADLVVRALAPILENAARHARRSVEVRIDEDDDTVAFTVSDDGRGVPVEEAEEIFAPGVRGAGSVGPGAGLGLPLARRLARSCGGDVSAEPSGAGGRFVLRLPALGSRRSGAAGVR